MAKLILTLDGAVLKEITLDRDTLSIGRRPGNDIQLNDLAVSGRHALLTIMQNTYVEDLGSTNGTLVNGKKIKKAILKNGDVIQVGSHQFTYMTEEQATYEPTMFLKAEFEPTMMLDTGMGSRQVTADTRGGPLGAVKILDGPMQGKVLELRKPFNTVGINGVKVALISREAGGYTIHGIKSRKLRRASDLPVVNGEPIGEGSRKLKDRDQIEMVDTRMEFFFM
ncbi:MAG: hypothetical protein Kow006_31810 [Gammaproteobacteria bacterium]